MIKPEAVLKISRKYRFQWEESQKKYVLLYAEGMVQLNETASEILKLCDGQHTVEDIINILQASYHDENLQSDVLLFITETLEKGWIVLAD